MKQPAYPGTNYIFVQCVVRSTQYFQPSLPPPYHHSREVLQERHRSSFFSPACICPHQLWVQAMRTPSPLTQSIERSKKCWGLGQAKVVYRSAGALKRWQPATGNLARCSVQRLPYAPLTGPPTSARGQTGNTGHFKYTRDAFKRLRLKSLRRQVSGTKRTQLPCRLARQRRSQREQQMAQREFGFEETDPSRSE